MTAEFRRLGKPGAYRLGRLRAQGIAEAQRPALMRPHFGRRPERRRLITWLAGLLAAVALITGGIAAGWWFVPVLAGLAAGAANQSGRWAPRVALPAVAVMALAGAAGAWLAAPHAVHPLTAADALAEALIGYAIMSVAAALRRA